jgi:putative hydrolase of the HAD superfamily
MGTGNSDMPILNSNLSVIVFDYGNTLMAFGESQMEASRGALCDTLEELYGECDRKRLKSVRERQMSAPHRNDFRENELEPLCRELIRDLYGTDPVDEEVIRLVQQRYDTFLESVKVAPEVIDLLNALRQHFRLGLLSNYPSGRIIRDSLDQNGLTGMFEAIVVSGEVGFVKPHQKPFETLLGQLDVTPSDCVFVGDNWRADIQGAKRMGMRAILTMQHPPCGRFDARDGDIPADAEIMHLDELRSLLPDETASTA